MDTKLRQALLEGFGKLRKSAIQCTYAPAEGPLGRGRSKIGGKPDVPIGFVWPCYEGESFDGVWADRPLSFLAQIDLAEASALDPDGLLPRTGLLSFFYEMETEKWGFAPEDGGCARVFYFADTDGLVEADFPENLGEDFRYPTFSVTLTPSVSLPSGSELFETPVGREIARRFPKEASECDWDDLDDLRAECGCPGDEWGGLTKLLGYPDVIQGPMERECEEVTRGIDNGRPHELPPELEAEIAAASGEWMLLFQMGTVEHGDFEIMFGDCGHVYFWIRRKDLAERNFDRVWLILQCG